MNSSFKEVLQKELDELKADSRLRTLSSAIDAVEPWLEMDGRRMLNLASNNYLGLAGDIRLKEASIEAVRKYGAGATASRLVVGNHPLYEEAEAAIRGWKKSSGALIFTSGFAANLGIFSTFCGKEDYIFSDKLNHASIVDGIRLCGAVHKRYFHNNPEHLESLLKKAPSGIRKWIVTDTLFSMDGDRAKLKDLVQLKNKYNALLLVDEAHATGVFGEGGAGLSYEEGISGEVDIIMGTFSKAMGSLGAYITGDRVLIDYLINKARGFIFTTALSPAILGSILAAVQVVQESSIPRDRLLHLSRIFREALNAGGFNTGDSESQIIPVITGGNEETIHFASRLRQNGIAGIAIRPPTVPPGKARIRFTVTAVHKEEDLIRAADLIIKIGKDCKIL